MYDVPFLSDWVNRNSELASPLPGLVPQPGSKNIENNAKINIEPEIFFRKEYRFMTPPPFDEKINNKN